MLLKVTTPFTGTMTFKGIVARIVYVLVWTIIVGAVYAALYYVPGFLTWLQSRSIRDGHVIWNVGYWWLFLLALALPVLRLAHLRLRGRWGFYDSEDKTHSFDFTHWNLDRRS